MAISKEQVLEQKRALVEQTISFFSQDVQTVTRIYESNRERLLGLPKQRAAIEQARSLFEKLTWNSEATNQKLASLEEDERKIKYIDKNLPKVMKTFEMISLEISFLNGKGFYLKNPLHEYAQLGERKEFAELEKAFSDWLALLEKQRDTVYYNSLMVGCAIGFVATLVCALYASIVGAIVAGVLTGALVYELRDYADNSIPKDVLDELEEAFSKEKLQEKLPPLKFFKPLEDDEVSPNSTKSAELITEFPRFC